MAFVCISHSFYSVLLKLKWSEKIAIKCTFVLMCHLDRRHHPVMKPQKRRKRRSTAGLTHLPMTRGGKRRSLKATKRGAKNIKRSKGKSKRRSRRRGNGNRLPPPPPRPAPVNPQTVTETHLWLRESPYYPLFHENGGLQTLWESGTQPCPARVSFTRTAIYKGAVHPGVDTAMKVKNVLERAHKAKELVPIFYFIFLPDPLSLHI